MQTERRILRADGTYTDSGNEDQAAATLTRGVRLLAEAQRTYGLSRRDRFSAVRLRSGLVGISRVALAPPMSAADEVAEARLELLAEKARAL